MRENLSLWNIYWFQFFQFCKQKNFMNIDTIVLRVYIKHFINDIEVKVQSQLLTVKWLIPIEFYIYSTSSP